MKPYYVDDFVTIYNADCRDVLPTLSRARLGFADPPYGVGMGYGAAYDDDAGAAHTEMTTASLAMLRAITEVTLLTPGIRNLWSFPRPTWVLGWFKPGSTRRSDLGGFNEWEPVLMYGKHRIYNDAKRLPDVANHAKYEGKHPCPKPMNLLQWLIDATTEVGDTVIDPFLGSGTTAIAAKNLGRKAVGIEIEERYCEIAARRLDQGVLDFGDVA